MADVNIKYKGTSIATIDASGSKTLQTSGKYCEGDIVVEYTDPEKPTQAKSATPTETAQDITPDIGKVLSKVSVGAIPKTYVGSGVTKKAAATVAPSTSEQTVCESGVYTTGAQKVAAITKDLLAQLDPDFMAANIKKDVDLFGLVGTLEAVGGGANNVSFGTYTMTTETSGSNKVEHSLGTTPAALLFVYVGLTSDISAKYDDALVAQIIPNKNSVSYRWMFYKSRFQSATLSGNATSQLWSTGTTNANYDRVNNINDQYFYTPTNCDVGTYFWAVFKEALI